MATELEDLSMEEIQEILESDVFAFPHRATRIVHPYNHNEQKFKREEKTGRKPLTSGQRTGILFMSWGLFIIAIGIIDYVDFKKTQRVKKQVEAFEKTLPAEYLEYKQAVEHYRDSLMNVKGR